jgi:hypothetical protein
MANHCEAPYEDEPWPCGWNAAVFQLGCTRPPARPRLKATGLRQAGRVTAQGQETISQKRGPGFLGSSPKGSRDYLSGRKIQMSVTLPCLEESTRQWFKAAWAEILPLRGLRPAPCGTNLLRPEYYQSYYNGPYSYAHYPRPCWRHRYCLTDAATTFWDSAVGISNPSLPSCKRRPSR